MLTRTHLAVMKSRSRTVRIPDRRCRKGSSVARVLDAMRAASDAMTALDVRHLIVGGLAVGANGYPRAST